jgi:hypothetical protein
MQFHPLPWSDRFWDDIARNFEQPSSAVPDTVVLLATVRTVFLQAVAYMRSFASEANAGALEHYTLRRTLRSHEDVIAAVDHALLHLSKGRGLTGTELWRRFERKHRETAVRAMDDIARVLRSRVRMKTGFSALPENQRLAFAMAIAGHTPLGAALARSPSFQRQVGAALENPRVLEAVAINGPVAGAMQMLASYLEVSVATIRRRRAAHDTNRSR